MLAGIGRQDEPTSLRRCNFLNSSLLCFIIRPRFIVANKQGTGRTTVRIILGVIVGFVVWSVLWLGSDQVLINLSTGWYGRHQYAFEDAMLNQSPFTPDDTILFMHLIRAIVISITAGFLAAFVAGENRKAPLGLGVLLLLFGAGVEAYAWNYLPLWYHAIFLLLLIPMSVIGGGLRSRTSASTGKLK